MKPDKDAPFTTIQSVCAELGVTRVTVEGWLTSGELPHYRLGPKLIRIARADYEQFLADRRLAGTSPDAERSVAERTSSAAAGAPDANMRNSCFASAPAPAAAAEAAA